MMLNEPFIWESWSKKAGFKELLKPSPNVIKQRETVIEQPCKITQFFESERAAGRDTKVAYISCDCPKCRIHC